jgi:hypothetical protein
MSRLVALRLVGNPSGDYCEKFPTAKLLECYECNFYATIILRLSELKMANYQLTQAFQLTR